MASIRNIAYRSLTGFMAVWLSGFLFLFCCPNAQGMAEKANSCPMAKSHSDCDKAKKAEASGRSIEAPAPICTNCTFLPVVFDKSRKVELANNQLAVPATELVVRRASFAIVWTKVIPSAPLAGRIPDRHGTYLRNRVFRI
jgi:hypothetical protein